MGTQVPAGRTDQAPDIFDDDDVEYRELEFIKAMTHHGSVEMAGGGIDLNARCPRCLGPVGVESGGDITLNDTQTEPVGQQGNALLNQRCFPRAG